MIRVGTAAWVDEGLLTDWYPPAIANKPRERLEFYQSHFDTVECNASYYQLLPSSMARQWGEWLEPGFTLHVKAFAALTRHWLPVDHLPSDLRHLVGKSEGRIFGRNLPEEVLEECWARFFNFVQPLRDAGKLGYLLFQFPPWFRPGLEAVRYLEEVARRTEGYLVATEFRHPAWYVGWKEVKDLLKELGMVHVTIDGPRLLEVPDTVAEATHHGHAVLRLHGRNAGTWNVRSGKASDRFNYWYGGDELKELLGVARALEEQAELVWVIFNNNYSSQSADGARGLLELLHVKDLGKPLIRIHVSAR